MKIAEVKIGICETCRHYRCERYDPSPSGVSLSPGYMIDEGCAKEEDKRISEDVGKDTDNQCPVWNLTNSIAWCPAHKFWYWGECVECEADYYKSLEQIEGK